MSNLFAHRATDLGSVVCTLDEQQHDRTSGQAEPDLLLGPWINDYGSSGGALVTGQWAAGGVVLFVLCLVRPDRPTVGVSGVVLAWPKPATGVVVAVMRTG